MLTQISLFAILISGSIWGSSVCKKHFEDMLPITCASIVAILFLCGILGFLKQGITLVLLVSFGLYSYSFFFLLRNKSWKNFAQNFVTPAFCIFFAAYIVLTYTNYGMMAAEWDEFTHWADIVKAMSSIDDFGTNPQAQAMFQSYPPGMSLFQYFFEKIYILLNQGELFSEWRLYFSYQIFFLSFLMPFLRKLTFRENILKALFSMLIGVVVCCFGPMLIFDDIYIIILIDAFLGLLAGTGMAMIFVRENKDWCYDAYVFFNIAMLVLAKDAGMLFAAFVFVTYIIDNVFYRKNGKTRQFLWTVLGLVSLLLPKILWNYNMKINGARVVFSNKIDIPELFRILAGIDKTSYRTEVINNFLTELISGCFKVGEINIGIPYIGFVIILMAACYGIYQKYKTQNIEYAGFRKMVLVLFVSECVVYIFGLCVTYMFKFSEYEAVNLACFERYMQIILQEIMIFLLMLLVSYIIGCENQKYLGICVLCTVLVFLPWGMIKDVAKRTTVDNTINTRIRYMPLVEKIEAVAKESGEILRINVISQESSGYDRLVLRYSLRPHIIVGDESIGKPFYDEDMWTIEKNAEQWQKELQEEADYVALYHLNDYFMEEFSGVFEKTEDIHENGLYHVNKKTGTLSLCDE